MNSQNPMMHLTAEKTQHAAVLWAAYTDAEIVKLRAVQHGALHA